MAIKGLEKVSKKMFDEVKVATYEDGIGKQLHPDYNRSFKSILGNLYSLGNGMRYLTSSDFKLAWLGRQLSHKEFTAIRKNGHRHVEHYWEIVKLLITDRLLSDKNLITELLNMENVHNVRFVPYLKIKKGIIDTEVENDKLRIYGIILTKLINHIVYRFKEEKITDVKSMDKDTYKKIKLEIKEDIFKDAVENTDGEILDGLVEMKNNELKRKFVV